MSKKEEMLKLEIDILIKRLIELGGIEMFESLVPKALNPELRDMPNLRLDETEDVILKTIKVDIGDLEYLSGKIKINLMLVEYINKERLRRWEEREQKRMRKIKE